MDERHRLVLLHLQRTDTIRTLANCLYQAAIKNFYILRKSHCAAVLTENFFMDNHSDLDFIQSQAGKQAIIVTHVEGIIEYLNSIK